MQWDGIERETLAYIGIMGNARAQGADVEIPTLAEARKRFDDWLVDDDDGIVSDERVIMRALGLGGGE